MVSSPGSPQPSTLVKIVVAVFVALAPVWVAVIVVTSVRPQPLPDYDLLALSSVAFLLALFVVQTVRSVLRRIEEKERQRPSLPTLPGDEPEIRLRWRLPFTGPRIVRGLSMGPTVAILSAVCVGTLAILSTFPILTGLPPAGSRPDSDSCEYQVGQRGTATCVTRIDYERFTLAGQRGSAGVNLIVSALLAGALLNRPHRSGQPDGTPRPTTGPPMPDIDPGPDVDTILRRSS